MTPAHIRFPSVRLGQGVPRCRGQHDGGLRLALHSEGAIEDAIGFQAAFFLKRFAPERRYVCEDVRSPNNCDRPRSVVPTTSQHDQAAMMILWADLAGKNRRYPSFCRRHTGLRVSCVTVDENSAIDDRHDARTGMLCLDATRLLRFHALGTDGGAHSDIFRPPAARRAGVPVAAPAAAPPLAAR